MSTSKIKDFITLDYLFNRSNFFLISYEEGLYLDVGYAISSKPETSVIFNQSGCNEFDGSGLNLSSESDTGTHRFIWALKLSDSPFPHFDQVISNFSAYLFSVHDAESAVPESSFPDLDFILIGKFWLLVLPLKVSKLIGCRWNGL